MTAIVIVLIFSRLGNPPRLRLWVDKETEDEDAQNVDTGTDPEKDIPLVHDIVLLNKKKNFVNKNLSD